MTSDLGVASSMAMILGTLIALLAGIVFLQTPSKSVSESTFIADPMTHKSKHAYEMFVLYYTPIWIGSFAIIVAFQLYESFTAWTYLYVCVGLSLPFLLQPLLLPSAGFGSPDANRPWDCRYATKANVWLAIYSFIGNYWYTHYFYTVLKAKYTMPAHRLNNVPIALYFATHFYFSTYHVFSNACLRKVVTTFEAGIRRQILFVSVVVVLSYFTAFMETLTISSFPYYSFEDRHTAYTVGSAFYGIYFLVSFPAFFAFNDGIDTNKQQPNLWDTVVSACGHGMLILILLDFVRLYLGIPLVVGEEESTADESITGYIAAYFASLWNSSESG